MNLIMPMGKPKLIRITTVPLSLEKLLEGQLAYMSQYYELIAVSSDKDRLERYGKHEGVRTFPLELTRRITPWKDLKAVYRLYRFLKKERPQIVHTHTPKAGIVGMMASYFAGIPFRLHTVAGLPLLESTGIKRQLLNFIEWLTYVFATHVYPNSHGLKEIILDSGFTSDKKLKVLGPGSSNGIDTSYFSKAQYDLTSINEIKARYYIPLDDFIFIFVGRIVKDKGINELVSAFNRLQRIHPHSTLLLIGDYESDIDPISPHSLDQIINHPKIINTGFKQDVRPYLAISDVLVHPSYREGFPNVLLQGGAMELPLIVTDINGSNEIVKHGENGLICPKKDEDSLFNAMCTIIEDKTLLSELQANARPSITGNYERRLLFNAIHQEYEHLLKNL